MQILKKTERESSTKGKGWLQRKKRHIYMPET